MRKTRFRRWLAALLTVALVLSLAPAAFADDPPPTIKLDRSSLSIPLGDEKSTITATVTNAEGDKVIWTSSSKAVSIAKTENGDTTSKITLSADEVGTATITADCDGVTSTCIVTVTSATVTKLELQIDGNNGEDEAKPIIKEMDFGSRDWIDVKVIPTWSDNGTSGPVSSRMTWTARVSGKSGVARLLVASGTGEPSASVEAIGVGTTEITFTVNYRNPGNNTVSKDIVCGIEVGEKTKWDVVITEYGVQTRQVSMTTGSPKLLGAYVAINNVKQDAKVNSTIQWSVAEGGEDIISLREPTTAASIYVDPLKAGTATLVAEYTEEDSTTGEKWTVKSQVVCIVTDPETPGGDPGTKPPDPITGDKLPEGVTAKITINSPTADSEGSYIMDPGSVNGTLSVSFTKEGTLPVNAVYETSQSGGLVVTYVDDSGRYEIPVQMTSSASDIATVSPRSGSSGGGFVIRADQPGNATLTFSLVGSDTIYDSAELKVTVKGFALLKKEVSVYENGSLDLVEDGIIGVYGGANVSELACWSDASNIAAYVNYKIAAYAPGTTTFTVSDTQRGFIESFTVEVKADPNATIGPYTIKSSETLPFDDLLTSFRRQAGGKLAYITGINLDAGQGTVYYKYNTITGAGTGVGAENYYHPYTSGGVPYGQRSLEDLTFVPKSNYAGEVNINYTGVSEDGKNYVCKLVVIVNPESGSEAGISLTTDYNTPLNFNGDDFNRVCRERLGVKLDYVTFSLPPVRQGTLYTNYVAAGDYGSAVDMRTRYSQKDLDSVWFVPAPGFSGMVTVYYTAFSTDGESFAGQVDIVVAPENGVAIGGLAFDTTIGGVARFDDVNFNSYCRQLLDYTQTLSFIRFDSLPDETEGVLYSGYSSTSNPGSRALPGTSYYYGTRTPRIDQLAFVPAENFVGTVKIPFTGWTVDGTSFSGNVEVNVKGGVAVSVGDIVYICAAGKTVNFDDTDFNRLSRSVTGYSLSYITFRSLPGSSSGTLYYNTTKATTTTNYRNGSSTPRIDNLSFQASSRFSGTVDIPFDARDIYGNTFRGVVTISSSTINSSGGTSSSGGASSTIFTDMAGYSEEQKAAVDFLYARNITHGLTTTQYGPQNSIRRGDFAVMLYTAFGFSSSGVSQAFVDVPSSAYYAQAVNALYSRGVVSGIGNGFYAPESTLTRQDAICMVQRAMRAAGRPAYDGTASALYSYSDGTLVSGYAQGAMSFAVLNGYLPVYGSWLSPTMPLTRIDMAEIIYRVLR